MDGRARIAFSGLAAFAVTATVVATVATTNAAAFHDAPGTVIDAAVVDVPATTETTAPAVETETEPPADSPAVDPADAPASTQADADAETVQAPAPAVIPPVPTDASPVPTPGTDVEVSLRDALASSDPDAVYAWAAAHGWSRDRVDRFLATRSDLRDRGARDDGKRHDDHRGEGRGSHEHPRSPSSHSPVQTGSPAVTETPQRGDGTKRDRSPGSPDHRD